MKNKGDTTTVKTESGYIIYAPMSIGEPEIVLRCEYNNEDACISRYCIKADDPEYIEAIK